MEERSSPHEKVSPAEAVKYFRKTQPVTTIPADLHATNTTNCAQINNNAKTTTATLATAIKHNLYQTYAKTTIKPNRTTYDQYELYGACIDTYTAKSICGLNQAFSYTKSIHRPLKLTRSNSTNRFGDAVYKHIGKLEVRIPTPEQSFTVYDVAVVQMYVQMLIELQGLKNKGLLPILNLFINR